MAGMPTITVEPFVLQVFRATRSIAELSEELERTPYFSATQFEDTLWIVARSGTAAGEVVEPECRLLRVTETTDFPTDLSAILAVLGARGVGVIPIGSYGGDHILIKREHLDAAEAGLAAAGYTVSK